MGVCYGRALPCGVISSLSTSTTRPCASRVQSRVRVFPSVCIVHGRVHAQYPSKTNFLSSEHGHDTGVCHGRVSPSTKFSFLLNTGHARACTLAVYPYTCHPHGRVSPVYDPNFWILNSFLVKSNYFYNISFLYPNWGLECELTLK